MQRHVLVVDTDVALAERIRQALRGRCVTVWAVASEEDAYRRIAAIPTLDALVLDADLGGRREVVRFAQSVIPGLGVVYIGGCETARSDPDSAPALLPCGAEASGAAERGSVGTAGAPPSPAPFSVSGVGRRTWWLAAPFSADQIVSSILAACAR